MRLREQPATRSVATLGDDEIVDAATVGRWLGISARSVMRSAIPRFNVTPRTPRFRVGDVRRWIAASTRGAA